MYKAIFYTHLISVNLFLLIYMVKTILLLANKDESLAKLTKAIKVPEMIISTLFLITGIYMLTQIPEIKTLMIIKIIAVFVSIPLAVIGFKKKNKALAVLAFLLIVGAYGMAEMSKKQKSAAVEIPVTSVNGEEIYTANCSRCHGDDGKSGLMGSNDLSVSMMSMEEKIEIIKNGKGVMNPFAGQLNDEQIKAVAEYTETLKK
ncbi:MAG: SirB2 family protein [Bacteroidetes bacterium]|nr:SirB2 family protein [Bacteroidota bacterium]